MAVGQTDPGRDSDERTQNPNENLFVSIQEAPAEWLSYLTGAKIVRVLKNNNLISLLAVCEVPFEIPSSLISICRRAHESYPVGSFSTCIHFFFNSSAMFNFCVQSSSFSEIFA